ncbi:MAG: ATP-dependent DNA helicase, partial [Candidatus Bathyarchaeota archaeon]
YCRFYLKNIRAKKQAEKFALDCARKILDPLEAVRIMSKRGFCAYEAIKKVLHRIDVFLGTYHYIFDPKIRHTLLKGLGVDLSRIYIIVDEAHNLPSFARELLSDRLTRFVVEGALKETERFNHEMQESVWAQLSILMEEIFDRARQTLKSDELKQISPQEISDLILEKSGIPSLKAACILKEYGEYVKEKRLETGSERVFSYNFRVGSFMEHFFENDGKNYIHLLSKGSGNRIALEVKGFDGRGMTAPILQQARGSILMSGFLSPLTAYKDLTLSEPANVCLKEFNSPFSPENRLMLIAKDVSSEFKRRTDEMLEKLRGHIEAISDNNQGNVAAFFTSYGLMHRILPALDINRNKIIEQQKTTENEVIRQLSKSTDNLLCGVMGGKLSEGVDYPNNILTCVVAVGLPYATWDIYQKALIYYLERNFPKNGRIYGYLVPAILRLVQTCGRVHRSPNDKGCIIILDRRVAHPNITQLLPKYFQNEIKVTNNQADSARQVRDFWYAHSLKLRTSV